MPGSIYDIKVKDLQGNFVKLEKYKGKCLLIVNIAFDCKLMKENMEQLRGLKQKFGDELAILLFPCIQFMGMPNMEPGEIASAVHTLNIDFAETFAVVDVNGNDDTHPLYTFLKGEQPGCISWNFWKFIVNKSGDKSERFNHRVLFPAIESGIKRMICE